jgi:hypothetical protein
MLIGYELSWACVIIIGYMSKDLAKMPNLWPNWQIFLFTESTYWVKHMNKHIMNWKFDAFLHPFCGDPFKGDFSKCIWIGALMFRTSLTQLDDDGQKFRVTYANGSNNNM